MANRTLGRGRTVPTHRLIPTWVLWVALAILVSGIVIWAGYKWPSISGFEEKKVWDWLSVVGVSLAIALVGWIVTRRQRERDEAVALEHTQDDALRAYLDQMSNLMIDQDLMKYSVRKVAQARTLAILLGLDSDHKRRPLKLVYELGLITRGESAIELKNAGLDHANLSELTLRGANLRCVDLRATDLSGADLSGADLSLADLRGTDLRRADLKGADLTEANLLLYDERDPERLNLHNLNNRIELSNETLSPRRLTPLPRRLVITRRDHWWPIVTQMTTTNLQQAILIGARLHKAYLGGADLSGADLRTVDSQPATDLHEAILISTRLRDARLDGANLSNSDLREADLRGANLSKTDLSGADLRGAKRLTQEQIERAIGDHKTRLDSYLQRPKSWSES